MPSIRTTSTSLYSRASALSILLSPEALISLNPLVDSFSQILPPRNPNSAVLSFSIDQGKYLPIGSVHTTSGNTKELEPVDVAEELEEGITHYTITDKIHFPLISLLFNIRTTYTATFTSLSTGDGMAVSTQAAQGVRTTSIWRIDSEGRVTEEGELRCEGLMKGFVESTWRKAHVGLMERLEERLKELQVESSASVAVAEQ